MYNTIFKTSDGLHIILASIASCNSKCYNTDTHLCCDGMNVTERVHEHIHCCGTESYSSIEYLCCNKKLQKWKNNLRCCGGKNFFDDSEKACCSGTLNKKEQKRGRGFLLWEKIVQYKRQSVLRRKNQEYRSEH